MTRVCSGCGLYRCEGDCYSADPQPDPEEGDTGVTLEELRERYGAQLTEVHGDPFGPSWSGSAPSRVSPSRPSGDHLYRKDKAA